MVRSFGKTRFLLGIVLLTFALDSTAQFIEPLLNKNPFGAGEFTKENISWFRESRKILTGKLHIWNEGSQLLNVYLYHSDNPGQLFSTTIIRPQQDGYCTYVIGNDWGIRFEINGNRSGIFFVGDACRYANGEFIIHLKNTGTVPKPVQPDNKIESTQIGQQIWMTKNLNTDVFMDGTPIPQAKSLEEWQRAGQKHEPAWCYYENREENGKLYGKLYNWYAVTSPHGLAPEGWHVPSAAEWEVLVRELGDTRQASIKLKSSSAWQAGTKATNYKGWNALPGGSRFAVFNFKFLGEYASWWTATPMGERRAYIKSLGADEQEDEMSITEQWDGLAVRCIKN